MICGYLRSEKGVRYPDYHLAPYSVWRAYCSGHKNTFLGPIRYDWLAAGIDLREHRKEVIEVVVVENKDYQQLSLW